MASQSDQSDPTGLNKLPTVPPPPGATIDLNGPNALEATIITVTTVFMALALILVGVRSYTKIKIKSSWSWDDLTCALGTISTLIYWIVILLQVLNEGFGQHLWNVPLIIPMSDAWFKLSYLADWFHNIAFIFVKSTFFILYWNIFKPFRWFRFCIIAGAAVVFGVYIGCTLAMIIAAAPPAGHSWRESTLQSPDSIGQRLSVPLAAWALASDVYILLLPITGVLQLLLCPKKKLAILFVFMTGIGACICSSLNIYYRTGLDDQDVTYTAMNVEILNIVELCVGICITCLPATLIFLRQFLPTANSLKPKPSSDFEKLRGSFALKRSHISESSGGYHGRTDGIDGPYWKLGDEGQVVGGEEEHGLVPGSTEIVETDVVAGSSKHSDKDDDGIHLTLDLEKG